MSLHRLSHDGLSFIKKAEGFRNKVYLDSAGLPTIGVGHLLTQYELNSEVINMLDGESLDYTNGLSDEQILKLLDQDCDRFEKAVNSFINIELHQYQFDCLVSFSFNIGTGAFMHSTLRRILNEGDYEGVPFQLRRWKRSGGKVIQGLINRREEEVKLWHGDYGL